MTDKAFEGARLFGLPHSYYTVIARSYLRMNQFGVSEVSSRHPDFAEKIYPQIKRGIIPVLELSDGTVIQDSLDIIVAGEALSPRFPALPEDSAMKSLAYLFFLYGSQALLKAAMHYRWTFYPDQKEFLDHAFGLDPDDPSSAKVMDKMRSYLPILGVTEQSIPHIESAFIELLKKLDAHFSIYPFILGEAPTLADYGMLGPLFAHLGRDPVPEAIMKREAPNVFRWTERMNAGAYDVPEYIRRRDEISVQSIPETLEALIEFIGRDYSDEISDRFDFIRQWLLENDTDDGEPVSIKPSQRAIGVTEVRYGDGQVQVAVQPYMLYIQRRLQASVIDASDESKRLITDLLNRHSLSMLLDPQLPCTVGRKDNIEIWEKV